jgi:hypothetical protein
MHHLGHHVAQALLDDRLRTARDRRRPRATPDGERAHAAMAIFHDGSARRAAQR